MLFKSAAGVVFALLMITVQAQGISRETPKPLAQLMESMDASCPQHVLGLVNRPDFAPSFEERPTNVGAVCRCTKAAFLADERLVAQFRADQQTTTEQQTLNRLKAYVTVRFVKSALVCMAQDIEKSLAAAKLGQ